MSQVVATKEVLTAISQYFFRVRMLGNWGQRGSGKHEYDASVRAMKHSDGLIGRIPYLEGLRAGKQLRPDAAKLAGIFKKPPAC